MQQPFSESAARLSDGKNETPSARLYREHAAALFAYLRQRAATREEAEDLLLEVFLAALEHQQMLEDRSRERQRAWLRSVAAHKLIDYYRRRERRQPVRLEEIAETLYADDAFAPEQMALHREEDERLRILLQRLPGLQRQVIHLRFVYDLRVSEIADVLGKKEGAVRKLLSRALNLARTLYAEE